MEAAICSVAYDDAQYPERLKQKFGVKAPMIFYYAGDLSLLERKCVGFVGSRRIDESGVRFTEYAVKQVNAQGYGVVSGGAEGVDSVAGLTSIRNGNICIHFVCHSLAERVKEPETFAAIRNGKLLLLSHVPPEASFKASAAFGRNKYIYAHSIGTIVVRCDFEKGGSWSGAMYSMQNHISPVFCWNHLDYLGNMGLLQKGAIPLGDCFSGVQIEKYLQQEG